MPPSPRKRKLVNADVVDAAELVGRPSPYHPSVTVFELAPETPIKLEHSEAPPRTPRRTSSPRKAKLRGEDSSEQIVEDITKVALATKHELEEQAVVPIASSSTVPSPRKQKPIQMELAVPHPVPDHWRETYDAISAMRKRNVAPVDTMGCHMPAELEEDPKTKRFVTLVALMLSSQTKDEVVFPTIATLRAALGGLTLENVLTADESVISKAIAKVGFWRKKTVYIKQAAQKLKDDFDGDVPKTVDELCSLPGVGPKMAFLCLQSAWKLNVGIGVDTHVHRITNRLGWHKPPTTTPEQTRLNLQSWLPKELHGDINHMLVGFGQTICVPVGPKCDQCDLSVRKLCPSARVVPISKGKAKGKAKIEVTLEASDDE